MAAPAGFELLRRPPAPMLTGVVHGLTGYRETSPGRVAQREASPLLVPLIISLGSPFEIAFGREPGAADRQPSFASGLHAGPVEIRSDGGAECVQLDLTPLGAARLFGPVLPELSSRIVDIEALFGPAARTLRERIGESAGWQERFDLIEGFVAARLRYRPSPGVAQAWRLLSRAGGDVRIAAVASEVGWSRKHLADRFRAELGIGPKAAARLLRFHRACRLARAGAGGWAGIAAACGYADQPHLARDFAELAGEAPTAWAGRLGALDPRLRPLAAEG
jgi:AraC-like DNA-binding protein